MAGDAVIFAGFGFRAQATQASLADALAACGSPNSIDACATAADKAEAVALQSLAAKLGAPVIALAAADLERQDTQTKSAMVERHRATGSVAEAAALAAAGRGARLLVARQISADRLASCALAEGEGV